MQNIASTPKLIAYMKMNTNMIKYRTYNFVITILLMCSICTGCHTIKIDKAVMHTGSKNPIALGVIGTQKDGIRNSEFRASAIPEYKKNIRVNITSMTFTQNTFNSYLKTNKENTLGLKYVDSLDNKPHFITLDILDHITLASELEEIYNSQTLSYIQAQKKAGIVTSLSLALSKNLISELKTAEAVFLSNTPYKQYQLSLVKNGKTYKTIDFTEAIIFAYDLSFFCWGENDKRQITIVDVISKHSSCSKNTYRSANKAKEKMNYFKL